MDVDAIVKIIIIGIVIYFLIRNDKTSTDYKKRIDEAIEEKILKDIETILKEEDTLLSKTENKSSYNISHQNKFKESLIAISLFFSSIVSFICLLYSGYSVIANIIHFEIWTAILWTISFLFFLILLSVINEK